MIAWDRPGVTEQLLQSTSGEIDGIILAAAVLNQRRTNANL
jgi:hypothetical protein